MNRTTKKNIGRLYDLKGKLEKIEEDFCHIQSEIKYITCDILVNECETRLETKDFICIIDYKKHEIEVFTHDEYEKS